MGEIVVTVPAWLPAAAFIGTWLAAQWLGIRLLGREEEYSRTGAGRPTWALRAGTAAAVAAAWSLTLTLASAYGHAALGVLYGLALTLVAAAISIATCLWRRLPSALGS